MAGVNVRAFQNLPNSVSINDIEVYCNGKYKMSGAVFIAKILQGLGVRKVTQPPQVYNSGVTVNVSIDIFVGEDFEVLRNGLVTKTTYNVGSGNKIVSVVFDIALDGDVVEIVKREIYSKI